MDIVLQVLLSVLIASIGDAPQLLAAVVAIHYAKMREVVAGVVLASAFNVVLSIGAGASLHTSIADGSIDPRVMMLLQSAGFMTAGLAMLFWRPKLHAPKDDGHGALFAVFVTMAALQLLDKSQFLMATFAARHGQPLLVGMGGMMALMLALMPAIFLRERLGAMLPLPLIRRIGGGVFCLVAAALIMRALGLVAV